MKLDWSLRLHKTSTKLIKDLSVVPKTLKLLGRVCQDSGMQVLSEKDPTNSGNNDKNWQIVLHDTKKLLHSKGSEQQSEERDTEWERVCEMYAWQEIDPEAMKNSRN